ncbi:MAG TPA: ribonuclease III [Candidatus Acidoferrales bacterium]
MAEELFEELEVLLGYAFRDRQLLARALTHSSHPKDAQPGMAAFDNEQLEFLGDAILGFVVSQRLVERFPEFSEGRLSKMKANLVSAHSLAGVAERLSLGRFLRLGRGEEKTGGRTKRALLVDAVEAVIAALYLDGGLGAATGFLGKFLLEERILNDAERLAAADHKSALQEWLQARGMPTVHYAVIAERGPEHQKTFTVQVEWRGRVLARAEGASKKVAEQAAARLTLEMLRGHEITIEKGS